MSVNYDASVATNNLLPVDFPAPNVNGVPGGLYAAIGDWQIDPDRRFLNGVRVRGANYGGENQFGVWGGGWCGEVITATSTNTDTWTVTVDGVVTSAIAHDATGATVQADIRALSSVGNEPVTVTSPTAGTWVFEFTKRHDIVIAGASISMETETKFGERPDILDPFMPVTVWAYDECDMTQASQDEIIARSQQVLALEEQTAVERELAARLLLDAADLGSMQTATDIALAVGYLEGHAQMTGTQLFFHLGAQWAAAMTEFNNLLNKNGSRYASPLGHIYVLGGGYVDGLDDVIVATSQPFGWRDVPQTTSALDTVHKDRFAAITERSVAIGYEACVAAVQITG